MKKTLNLKFFLLLVAGTGLLCAGAHFVHGYQVRRNAGALLVQAERAEEEGNLSQAADYLRRYLGFVPRDTPVLARYALLRSNAKLATSPRTRLRALLDLDHVLRRDPQRQDVRRQAVRLAMSLQRFPDARDHLTILLESNANDGELHQLLGQCHEAAGNHQAARASYEAAVRQAPGEVVNHERLAHLLRRWTNEVLQGQEKPSEVRKLADKIMDDMVAANDRSFRAYLARARYHRALHSSARGSQTLEAVAKDVERAWELAPEEADVILAAADLAEDRRELQKARDFLQTGCKRHPQDWRMYQALARLEVRQQQDEAALACLREGVKQLPRQVDLLWELTELLIRRGHKDEAGDIIAQLKRAGFPPAELDYLNACILIHDGQWLQAARMLETVYPALTGREDQQQDWFLVQLAQQTALRLARCYEQLGDSDRASAAYGRVLARDARSLAGRVGLALTHQRMGRIKEALDQYQLVLRLPDAPPAYWLDVARLLIWRNRENEQSDWAEVEQALAQCDRLQPQPVEVVLLRAEALAAQKRFDAARQLLLDRHGDPRSRPAAVWVALAELDQRQGNADGARKLLGEARREVGDQLPLRIALARYWAGHPGEQARKALAELAEGLDRFNVEERHQLLRVLAGAYLQVGETAQSRRWWDRLAEELPSDLGPRIVLFDLALEAGDEDGMRRWVAELQRIEGPAGTLWRYGRVCHLIGRAKRGHKEGLEEARELLAAIAMRRSSWSRVPLCEAQIEDLLGNPDAALAGYRRAIAMGERSPLALRRTIELLYQRRRYIEAYQLFQKMPEAMTRTGDFQRVGAEIALRAQDHLRALSLAQRAVPAESRDYRDYLWLGQICWMAGKPEKAGPAFQQARDLAENVPDTWVALIQYLAFTGQKAKAQAELEKALSKLKPTQDSLALAQCYEAVGEPERAEELYQGALASRPDDLDCIRGIATYYLRTGRFRDAQPHLRRISTEYKGRAPEAAEWARRTYAVLLALGGNYQQSREALAMLSLDPGPARSLGSDAVQTQRTRAAVLAMQQNRRARREAIQLLESLIERKAALPEDHFLLAQLHEALGEWPKARVRFLYLLEVPGGNAPFYLAHYARSLLRQRDVEEAQRVLDRLKKLEPDSLPTKALDAQLLHARGNTRDAIDRLKDHARQRKQDAVAVARLLEDLGDLPAAEAMYRDFVGQSPKPESGFVLVQFLRRQKRHAEALEWCERAWATCNTEAVAQVWVAILAETRADPVRHERLGRRLQARLQQQPGSVPMTAALAVLRKLQGRLGEAEAIYRQLLKANPNFEPALNNLAWLLAHQDGKAEEAWRLVERAYELRGPEPGLLDTRAVIHLAQGRPAQAIQDLEEAIATAPAAEMYFHLARACQLGKDARAAAEALRKAQSLGLQEDDLHPRERTLYHQLCQETGIR